ILDKSKKNNSEDEGNGLAKDNSPSLTTTSMSNYQKQLEFLDDDDIVGDIEVFVEASPQNFNILQNVKKDYDEYYTDEIEKLKEFIPNMENNFIKSTMSDLFMENVTGI